MFCMHLSRLMTHRPLNYHWCSSIFFLPERNKKWNSEKAALLEFSQNMNPSFQCKIDLSFDTLSIHEDTFMLYTYDVHKVCSKKMCGKTFLLPMIEDLRRYL